MLYPDSDDMNADWTKMDWTPPEDSAEEFRDWLKRQGMPVDHFKRLPVYQLNKERISWLKDL